MGLHFRTNLARNYKPPGLSKKRLRWNRLLKTFFLMLLLVVVVGVVGVILPAHHTVTRKAAFNQSVDEIWQAITDYPSFPAWRPDLAKVEMISTTYPVMFREIDRFGNGLTYRVVESYARHRYKIEIADEAFPVKGSWTMELHPTAKGCTLTITEEGMVKNPFIRFFYRVFFKKTATIDQFLKALSWKYGEEAK